MKHTPHNFGPASPALSRPILPFLRRASSWRNIRAFAALRPRFFRRAVASAVVLLLTLCMLGRTLAIGTNDLFHFGVKDRWWCYAIVNYFHLAASVETYVPGVGQDISGPAQQAFGPGWFFFHRAANGGSGYIAWGGPFPTIVSHDYGLFGWNTTYRHLTLLRTTYWLNLPFLPPLLTAVSALILALWLRAYLRHLRQTSEHLCPTCAYDLRMHQPGQKCPECGAPIAAKEGKAP